MQALAFDIQLGGETRRVWLSWRACHSLGMKGTSDASGYEAAVAKAAADFNESARLVHATLVDRSVTVEQVLEWTLDEWDVADFADFIKRLWGTGTAGHPGEIPTTAQASDLDGSMPGPL